ncbi:hypothetical protein AB2M62_15610 [Sphingomonas sp. MMS12-HWE2-04]|uniref:hypothetical protein n=1 Tax=Sphingomonas sp. MMS12-HWE2-04 TaxID=3234199 RepID=UPI00385162B5
MMVSTAPRYPRWLLTVVVAESAAVIGTGGFILVLIDALSGPLSPERWAQAGWLWLGLPAVASLAIVATGFLLIRRGWVKVGIAVTPLPLLLLCLFLLWANI